MFQNFSKFPKKLKRAKILKIQKKGMTKSRNLFLKIYKKVDDGTMA